MRIQIVDQHDRVLLESSDPGLVQAAGQTIALYAGGACEDAGDSEGVARHRSLYNMVSEATEPVHA